MRERATTTPSQPLIEHYDPGLRALAYRLLEDADRTDDALQEAYVRAYKALPRFRGESTFWTWLYRIVYNRSPCGDLRLDFPTGAEVSRSHDGFRRVGVSEVAAVVGYEPLVPTWVPDGYEPAVVAVATKGGPTGVEAGNPESRMVVSLAYRRGFDQFLVTTRLARPSGAVPVWNDPLTTGEGFVDRREQVTLRRGALRGVPAKVVIVPRGLPHLWALDDELVVTVAGDLSRAELLRVAESLQRRSS